MIHNLQWLLKLRQRASDRIARATAKGDQPREAEAEVEDSDEVELLGWRTRLIQRATHGATPTQTATTIALPSPRTGTSPNAAVQATVASALAAHFEPTQTSPHTDASTEALMAQFWDPMLLQDMPDLMGSSVSKCEAALTSVVHDGVGLGFWGCVVSGSCSLGSSWYLAYDLVCRFRSCVGGTSCLRNGKQSMSKVGTKQDRVEVGRCHNPDTGLTHHPSRRFTLERDACTLVASLVGEVYAATRADGTGNAASERFGLRGAQLRHTSHDPVPSVPGPASAIEP
jgi:hypothetical protein